MNPQNQSVNNRPAVVLAGWLGCQPRHLRRYSEMYDCIGWDSLVRIGSPRSVITATTEVRVSRTNKHSGLLEFATDSTLVKVLSLDFEFVHA